MENESQLPFSVTFNGNPVKKVSEFTFPFPPVTELSCFTLFEIGFNAFVVQGEKNDIFKIGRKVDPSRRIVFMEKG